MAQPKRELGEHFNKVCAAVKAGNSVIALGEAGTGTIDFAQSLYEEMLGDFQAAIAIYKGSLKNFFKTIAYQLEIPTENEDGKAMNVDALKEEIAANCDENTLLILPEAKRLTTAFW
jgi:hypothetical protein